MPSRRGRAALILLALVGCLLALAPVDPGHAAAPADTHVLAFPTTPDQPFAPVPPGEDPPADPEEDDGCSWYDVFCAVGSAAGELVTDVWIMAMLSLWEAGLWVLGLAFGVIDGLTTPDLSPTGRCARCTR